MSRYVCAKCGVGQCKLWRPSCYTSPLVCARCVFRVADVPPVDIDRRGQVRDPAFTKFNGKTQQFAGHMPAIPDDPETCANMWTFTTVPLEPLHWWQSLPTYPRPDRTFAQ